MQATRAQNGAAHRHGPPSAAAGAAAAAGGELLTPPGLAPADVARVEGKAPPSGVRPVWQANPIGFLAL